MGRLIKSSTLILHIFLILVPLEAQVSLKLEWVKQFGGRQNDAGLDMAMDASGNVYITGVFNGMADFNPGADTFNLISNGDKDIFISKINSQGALLWAKKIGGKGGEYVESISADAAGNVYILGEFSDSLDLDPGEGVSMFIRENRGLFILKLDPSGNYIWARQFDNGAYSSLGASIRPDAFGNIYIIGQFQGTVDLDPGENDYNLTDTYGNVFILKLDSHGDFVWAKQIGGFYYYSLVASFSVDASGNLCIVGDFDAYDSMFDFNPGDDTLYFTSTSLRNVFILKIDSTGAFLWAKQIGGETSYDVGYFASSSIDDDGNIYTFGRFGGTIDFDPGDGIFEFSSYDVGEIYLSKLDSYGKFLWAKQFGIFKYSYWQWKTSVDAEGNIYVIGGFDGSADFDPNEGTHELTGDYDTFILKLDSSGNFLWVKQLENVIPPSRINVDLFGNIYTMANFIGTRDLDPRPDTLNFTSFGEKDIFLLKMSQKKSVAIIENVKNNFTFYPNPTNDLLTIETEQSYNYSLEIISLNGQLIFNTELEGTTHQIDISSFQKGVYLISISSDDFVKTKKIIKL